MPPVVDAWAREALAALEARQQRRALAPLESPQGPVVRLGGRELLNFSSNDYLGLANAPEVVAAAREALLVHGAGAGASRLVVGDSQAHHALEAELARFCGTEAALLFNSGYAANLGVLAALVGPGDVVFSDALNHASLIDGCRLSRARVVVYPHGDVEALEVALRATPGRRRLVVTDTVFSMDGDVAPVRALREVCDSHGAALLVDEAHATGVLGPRGAGLCEAEGVVPDVHVGTLSKALGAFGAYVAGSRALCDALVSLARPLVFSTALPPAVCAAASAALVQLRAPGRRDALRARIDQLARGLRALGFEARGESAIFSLVLGDEARALEASARLLERGVLVKAIRPPTVPPGTSRLRVSVMASHSALQVSALLDALSAVSLRRAPGASLLPETTVAP
jgi:8-amino-7-oxononanoate synthase